MKKSNILLLTLVIFFGIISVLSADRYGRSDRTNSPAYHSRHYNYFPNYSNSRVYINYEYTPTYLPRNYYGYPYAENRGNGIHHPVFGVKLR